MYNTTDSSLMLNYNKVPTSLTSADVCFETPIPVFNYQKATPKEHVDETHPNYVKTIEYPSFYIQFATYEPPNKKPTDKDTSTDIDGTTSTTSPTDISTNTAPSTTPPAPTSAPKRSSLTSMFKQTRSETKYPYTVTTYQTVDHPEPTPLYLYHHLLPRTLTREFFIHHVVELLNSNININFSKKLLYENLFVKFILQTPHTIPDSYDIDVGERMTITETSGIVIHIAPNSLSQTISPPPTLASHIAQQTQVINKILQDITDETQSLPVPTVSYISYIFHHQKPFLNFKHQDTTIVPTPTSEHQTSTNYIYGPTKVNTNTNTKQNLYADFNLSVLKNKSIIDKNQTIITQEEAPTCIANSIPPEDDTLIDLYRYFRVKNVNDMLHQLKVYTFNPQTSNSACFCKSYLSSNVKANYPRSDQRSTAVLKTKFRYTISYRYNELHPEQSTISPLNNKLTPKQFAQNNYNKTITFALESFVIHADGSIYVNINFETRHELTKELFDIMYLTVNNNRQTFFKIIGFESAVNSYVFNQLQYKLFLASFSAVVHHPGYSVDFLSVDPIYAHKHVKVLYNCQSSRRILSLLTPTMNHFHHIHRVKRLYTNVTQSIYDTSLQPYIHVKNIEDSVECVFSKCASPTVVYLMYYFLKHTHKLVKKVSHSASLLSESDISEITENSSIRELYVKLEDKYKQSNKQHLTQLLQTDEKLFGDKTINSDRYIYSQLVGIAQQRPKVISKEDYTKLQAIIPHSCAAIPYSETQVNYYLCSNPEYTFFNFNNFKQQYCVPKCTKILYNKKQFTRCALKHLINVSDVVDQVDQKTNIPSFELNGQPGIITTPPAEFRSVLANKYCMRLSLSNNFSNNVIGYCLYRFNLTPFVIKKDPNSDCFNFLSVYDDKIQYCLVLCYGDPEEYYVVMNDSVDVYSATVLNTELLNMKSLILKLSRNNEYSQNLTHISWLARLIDRDDYPKTFKDINNRVIFVTKNKFIIGFLYKYVYFNLPLTTLSYDIVNRVDNVKVKQEIMMKDEFGGMSIDNIYNKIYKKVFNKNLNDVEGDLNLISDQISDYIDNNYIMNKHCAMVNNKKVYDLPYRIRYPQLSVFNAIYIQKFYVSYNIDEDGVSQGVDEICAIKYNGVIQYVDDDIRQQASKSGVHPYLQKYKKIPIAYMDKVMKFMHLENDFKFKALNQRIGIKQNILMKNILNFALTIYYKSLVDVNVFDNKIRNEFLLRFDDVVTILKMLKLFGPQTLFSMHSDSNLINVAKTKLEYDDVKLYWEENHHDGITFEEINSLLYYYNKDNDFIMDKNTSILVKDYVNADEGME